MNCADTRERIDAFVDGELEPSGSVEVARHLSGCAPCDRQVQAMLATRDVLVRESDRGLAELDLSGVWPAVAKEMDRSDAQRAWRDRGSSRRGVSRGITWGAVAAIAAGTMLYLRPVGHHKSNHGTSDTSQIVRNTKRPPNHVVIDRLAGKDIALRREAKSGTTMIWVNHEVESSGW